MSRVLALIPQSGWPMWYSRIYNVDLALSVYTTDICELAFLTSEKCYFRVCNPRFYFISLSGFIRRRITRNISSSYTRSYHAILDAWDNIWFTMCAHDLTRQWQPYQVFDGRRRCMFIFHKAAVTKHWCQHSKISFHGLLPEWFYTLPQLFNDIPRFILSH